MNLFLTPVFSMGLTTEPFALLVPINPQKCSSWDTGEAVPPHGALMELNFSASTSHSCGSLLPWTQRGCLPHWVPPAPAFSFQPSISFSNSFPPNRPLTSPVSACRSSLSASLPPSSSLSWGLEDHRFLPLCAHWRPQLLFSGPLSFPPTASAQSWVSATPG